MVWAPFLEQKDEVPPEQWPDDIQRASGATVCSTCGKLYGRHSQPAKATCPTIVVLCDGRWVKT